MDQCPKCQEKTIASVEYTWDSPQHYDGTSEWVCMNCGARFGRWCKIELSEGEIEPRYCTAKTTGSNPHTRHGVGKR